MNKINTLAHITRISSRVDGSLGISLSTPELSPQEKALFFELHNVECSITIEPIDTPDIPEIKIDKDLSTKSPSERMRGVLYRLWEKEGKEGEFKNFYYKRMESMIEHYKSKLD